MLRVEQALSMAAVLATAGAFGVALVSGSDGAQAAEPRSSVRTASLESTWDLVRAGQGGFAMFSGRSEPGAKIELRSSGQLLGAAVANAAGQWHLSVRDALTPGEHVVRAFAAQTDSTFVELGRFIRISIPSPVTTAIEQSGGDSRALAQARQLADDANRHFDRLSGEIHAGGNIADEAPRASAVGGWSGQAEPPESVVATIGGWFQRTRETYGTVIVRNLAQRSPTSDAPTLGQVTVTTDEPPPLRLRRSYGGQENVFEAMQRRIHGWLTDSEQDYRTVVIRQLSDPAPTASILEAKLRIRRQEREIALVSEREPTERVSELEPTVLATRSAPVIDSRRIELAASGQDPATTSDQNGASGAADFIGTIRTQVADWLTRSNRDYQNVIVRRLSKTVDGTITASLPEPAGDTERRSAVSADQSAEQARLAALEDQRRRDVAERERERAAAAERERLEAERRADIAESELRREEAARLAAERAREKSQAEKERQLALIRQEIEERRQAAAREREQQREREAAAAEERRRLEAERREAAEREIAAQNARRKAETERQTRERIEQARREAAERARQKVIERQQAESKREADAARVAAAEAARRRASRLAAAEAERRETARLAALEERRREIRTATVTPPRPQVSAADSRRRALVDAQHQRAMAEAMARAKRKFASRSDGIDDGPREVRDITRTPERPQRRESTTPSRVSALRNTTTRGVEQEPTRTTSRTRRTPSKKRNSSSSRRVAAVARPASARAPAPARAASARSSRSSGTAVRGYCASRARSTAGYFVRDERNWVHIGRPNYEAIYVYRQGRRTPANCR